MIRNSFIRLTLKPEYLSNIRYRILHGSSINKDSSSSASVSEKQSKGKSREHRQPGKIKNLADTLILKTTEVQTNDSISIAQNHSIQNKNESKITADKYTKSSALPKIYTRTGDHGTSVLLGSGPNRLPKESLVFDVLGTVDELSSAIGIVLSTCSYPSVRTDLENIQHDLFDIGSCVAANNQSSRFKFNDSQLILNLEKKIDQMTGDLPPLRNFILPGGGSGTASHVHLARAVCRRSERLMTKWLNQQKEENQTNQQDTVMSIYLNRLSDYLFTLARYITYKEGFQEIIYYKRT